MQQRLSTNSNEVYLTKKWAIFHALCRRLIFFLQNHISKSSFRNTIRASNSLDPDQARHYVGPDLDPNCLQMLSTDETGGQIVKVGVVF